MVVTDLLSVFLWAIIGHTAHIMSIYHVGTVAMQGNEVIISE